ncbi:hypothetical protein [Paraburkholderia sp. SG-MS1]|uniref:hypothetical protein n=1 Tax=Paraburkholderia sp. SG-MS1 TaxID=2023741 RepID=UPI001EEBB9ED|nr:hypothetical protein [Paraburkholderia sp. SG-MS1]
MTTVATVSGFALADATREIDAVLASRYVHGTARLRNRLRKREWMWSVYGALDTMHAASGVIERRERLSNDKFFERRCFQNRPVVITGAFYFWPACGQCAGMFPDTSAAQGCIAHSTCLVVSRI